MADATTQLGRLESEDTGDDRGSDYGEGCGFSPVGAKAEDQQSCDAAKTNEVEKRGSFFRHILMHFGRDVPFFVQRGFDLAHFKAGMSQFSSLHHHRGNQVGQNAKGETDGENGFFSEKETCKKNRGNEEDEGHGEMVHHDVDVFGLKKAGVDAHPIRLA